MKLVAIERELKAVDWEKESLTLFDEAKTVYQMILSGSLREIYFTETKSAVLILECKDKPTAKRLLGRLPLVKKQITGFEIIELRPYTGLSRLIGSQAGAGL